MFDQSSHTTSLFCSLFPLEFFPIRMTDMTYVDKNTVEQENRDLLTPNVGEEHRETASQNPGGSSVLFPHRGVKPGQDLIITRQLNIIIYTSA